MDYYWLKYMVANLPFNGDSYDGDDYDVNVFFEGVLFLFAKNIS